MEKVLLVERTLERMPLSCRLGLLGIEDLSREEIQAILDRARDFQPRDGEFPETRYIKRENGGESFF